MKRYTQKDSEFEVYNDFYCRYKVASKILNPGSEIAPSIHTQFWTKSSLQSELFRYFGDEKGKRSDSFGAVLSAYIPSLNNQLSEVEKQYQNLCEQAKREGKEKPVWPIELFKKKMKLEASLDILNLEAEKIKSELEKIQDVQEETDETQLLKNGPRGLGTLRDGKLQTIDGMNVTENEEGLLIISDNREKAKAFNGYSTADYYKYIVTEYKINCSKSAQEIQKQIDSGKLNLTEVPKGKLRGSVPYPVMPASCKRYLPENVTSK
jgi:hypothetical protein